MAATVDVVRLTGAAPGTPAVITNGSTRFNAIDSASATEATSPVQIPATGSAYSYWASTRLSCSATPAGTINNIRWYSDGSNNFGTGVTAVGNEATGYTQASGMQGQSGTPLTPGNYSGGTLTAPVDVFSFTPSAPKQLAGSLSNPATGQFGSLFVMQLVVGPSAGPGTIAPETFTWRYDET